MHKIPKHIHMYIYTYCIYIYIYVFVHLGVCTCYQAKAPSPPQTMRSKFEAHEDLRLQMAAGKIAQLSEEWLIGPTEAPTNSGQVVCNQAQY